MISIFIFSSSLKKESGEFIVSQMDLADIGSSISEISEYNRRINKNCVIILLDISQLIHIFNASHQKHTTDDRHKVDIEMQIIS